MRRPHRTVGATQWNVKRARALRRKMTLPEVLLWQQLRQRPAGLRFRRQFPRLGFVADFACLERRVIVEIDGAAHSMGDNPRRDGRRDAVLSRDGFLTLRIAAKDVLADLDSVILHIASNSLDRPLHRSAEPSGPPPRSGEEF